MAKGLHGDHHTVGDIYPGYALRRSDASKLKLLDPMHSDDGGWSLLLRNADDNGAASLHAPNASRSRALRAALERPPQAMRVAHPFRNLVEQQQGTGCIKQYIKKCTDVGDKKSKSFLRFTECGRPQTIEYHNSSAAYTATLHYHQGTVCPTLGQRRPFRRKHLEFLRQTSQRAAPSLSAPTAPAKPFRFS